MQSESTIKTPDSIVPEKTLPMNSPAKDLQAQAESVAKLPIGDKGPPKNLQALPTQDTDPGGTAVVDPGIASEYQCPVCSQKIPKDLVLFLEHGKQHVINSIRKAHPEWVDQEGVCAKCADHYEEAMQAGTAEEIDISASQKTI